MPFGSIGIEHRIGIAHCVRKNAGSFGSSVLHLDPGFFIYQNHLIHSNANTSGPAKAGAEWCQNGATDDDYQNVHVLREISAHDTQWSRRNLTDSPYHNWQAHSSAYLNQIYFVNNEPDMASKLEGDNPGCSCWNPRDRLIDQYLSSCFPNYGDFWESQGGGWVHDNLICTPTGIFERAKAEVLGYIFLRMKSDTESLGRGHVVLPPSQTGPDTGKSNLFWRAFYDAIHNFANNNPPDLTVGSCSISTITPTELTAIHFHHYTGSPEPQPPQYPDYFTPNEMVAASAGWIREAMEWYQDRYYPNQSLPFDILISEMGPNWAFAEEDKWGAKHQNYRDALAWWNTYLCWITRRAPVECDLKDWAIGEHTVYAGIHDPANPPYIVHDDVHGPSPSDEGLTSITRNQTYLDMNSLSVQMLYDAAAVEVDNLSVVVGEQTYQNSFLTDFNSVTWEGEGWHLAPLGTCIKVWSAVGADPISPSTDLNQGWVYTEDDEVVATADIVIPEGYSTVLFPVIKSPGDYSQIADPRITFTWIRPDYSERKRHGMMAFQDFGDYEVFGPPTYPLTQSVYPAMVYPVVCKSHPAYLIKVDLYKRWVSNPGEGVWLGRPIVIPRILSWFIEQ